MTSELTVHEFDLACRKPLVSADGRIDRRRGFAIRVRHSAGIGIGEATPLPGWSESLAACRQTLHDVSLDDFSRHPARLHLPTDRPAARHALQLAIMDLGARAANESLARYLGGPGHADRVAVNATLGDDDLEATTAAAERAVDDGFLTIKCKVGSRPLPDDIERIRAVRAAIGSGPELRIDANRSWSPHEAREALAGIEAADVSYVEEPLADPTPDGLASLRDQGTGIAIDETLAWERTVTPAPWLEVVDVVILKPMVLGGIDRATAIATAARQAGVTPVVSTTVDAVVARTAAVHLAAALPGTAAAGLATASWLEDDLAADPAPVHDGSIAVPDAPGIGTRGPWDGPAGTREIE